MNALVPFDQTKATEQVAKAPVTTRPQDWEALYSPGHLLGARLKFISNIALPFAFAAFVGSIFVATNMTVAPPSGFPVPREIEASLLGDPMTATDLGTIKVSYRYHWMQAHAPASRGLDPAQWTALVSAVKADAQQFGTTVEEWATVGGLEATPRITRPAKVFDADANLATGTIAIGERGSIGDLPVNAVIAGVDGQWAIALVDFNGRCATVAGPAVESCDPIQFDQTTSVIDAMRPVAQPQE